MTLFHRKEPVSLASRIVIAIHHDLLTQYGGMPGLRDEGLFESALARAKKRWNYREAQNIFDRAASYGFG